MAPVDPIETQTEKHQDDDEEDDDNELSSEIESFVGLSPLSLTSSTSTVFAATEAAAELIRQAQEETDEDEEVD